MADPTGTIGLRPETQSDVARDLALAASGGPKFVQRLQELGDDASRLEEAAAKVGIGDDIEGALRQAKAKLADAEVRNQKAAAALAAAQSRAAAIIEQAGKEASATVEAAQAVTAKAEAEADQMRKTADAYAKRVRDEADTIIRADAARREAEAKGREIDGKLSRLNAELLAIRREWSHVA
jgi:F0F1-type ATP synthase membrane subunit b/b'